MAFNATAEARTADGFGDIRLFTVEKCKGGGPDSCSAEIDDPPRLELINSSFEGARWVRASGRMVFGSEPWSQADYRGWEAKIGQVIGGRGFSAACWYFGRELYKRRRYPIGLVWSSIGGSSDEVWVSSSSLSPMRRLNSLHY